VLDARYHGDLRLDLADVGFADVADGFSVRLWS
jgi:hypothetical protein